jgi:hypothetical protein
MTISHSFSHKGKFYAACLKSLRLVLEGRSGPVHEVDLSMGWTKYLIQRTDTAALAAIMAECVTVSNDRLKIEEGKLFKKCKGTNQERYYHPIPKWEVGGMTIHVEIPLIEIINPEIRLY